METPSMCPHVCVGSLVADKPLRGVVHVGEVITFHPPGDSAVTYTHEISRVLGNGMMETRGVGNPGHDPWLITRSDIVGEEVFTLWGIGWLLKALPFLAVGVVAWMMVRPWIGRPAQRAWDRSWITVLTVLPLWAWHPLVRATVLSTANDPSHRHWARSTVVNSGILPVSLRAPNGGVVSHVVSAHTAQVAGPLDRHGLLMLHEGVSLSWWGWTIVAVVVVSPLAGCLWHSWRDDEAMPDSDHPVTKAKGPPLLSSGARPAVPLRWR
jgi:hypothetical protein